MTVRYFTSKNDINHNNRHVIIDEKIEFVAFPYQPYYARINNMCAIVYQGLIRKHKADLWHTNIGECLENGCVNWIEHKEFISSNDAFEFAANGIDK